jgi:FMN-dependent NADH-azoreductase
MKLLHIDSAITGDASVSRQLSAAAVARLKATTPDLDVVYHDLNLNPVPHLSGEVLGAKMTGADHAEAAATIAALDEFLSADIVVIGAPMYNFAISSQLKTWIDALAVAGKTFRYTETGPEGLAGDRRVIIASSRGGVYSSPSPMAAIDHQETYLTAFFGFIGIKPEFVRAEGLLLGPDQKQAAIDGALAEAAAL